MSETLTCPSCGNAKAEPWHLICDPCWSKAPESLKGELLSAHKEGAGNPRHRKACRDILRMLEESRGLKSMEMITPIKGLVHVCTVRSDDGWEAMCCLWDGERWLVWEDQFDPPEWSPVTDMNCIVEAWDLPIMPGSPVYRNQAPPPHSAGVVVSEQMVITALDRYAGKTNHGCDSPYQDWQFTAMRAALVAALGGEAV